MSDNALLLEHARTGARLPPGEFLIDAPLTLADGGALRGAPGGSTILRPAQPASHVPVINLVSTFPSPADLIYGGLPNYTLLCDLKIIGTGTASGEYGWMVRGACIRIERVHVTNCHYGGAFVWSVDTAVRDCLLSQNYVNIYINDTITTTRFSGCNIREAMADGIRLHSGQSVLFDDSIIESNRGVGMVCHGSGIAGIRLRDVWFENNGVGSLYDPHGLVKREGVTGTH